ncbi:flavin reductase [Pseudonocardia sp. C8]|uniref:flavin reductase family protein n=1 Tax=Pseudonocardia sp. C8 TaxID=2762759 RepID=UPI0016429F4C|nr:flavin reductase family protein [Pseudonocardia sp. C8]MBC3191935.1 flavin reductase [Pseudonocardia sp. C8]
MNDTSTCSPRTASPVPPGSLRETMRRFATGVAVVATTDRGSTYAAVVNSFTSVSLEPPLVLVCLQVGSRTCEALQRRGAFSICVLADEHREHSQRLARSQPTSDDDAFEVVDGLPTIRGTLAGLLCEVESVQVKGDHVIVVGCVVRTHHAQREPLVFYDGQYRMLDGQAAPDSGAVTATK